MEPSLKEATPGAQLQFQRLGYFNVDNDSSAAQLVFNKTLLDDKKDLHDDMNDYAYREGIEWTKASLLGSGAYSNCYQARDVLTGTIMAVKQISNLNDVSCLSQFNEAGSFQMPDSIGISSFTAYISILLL